MSNAIGKLVSSATFMNLLVVRVREYDGLPTMIEAYDQRERNAELRIKFYIPQGDPLPKVGRRISGFGLVKRIDDGVHDVYKSGLERDEDFVLTYELEQVTWA